MPPKKKVPEPSKKAEVKKKEKIIEDKTFGLKNKKGAKNQKFIQQVEKQVKQGSQSARKLEDPKKKDDKKKEAEELNMLFKPVVTQRVEKGTDPKSVLCAFFKQGHCSKGDKCKFSHDPNVERKGEKKNVYVDIRDEDKMEFWDEEKLKEVVEKKHGEAERKMPKTTIICKFFLDALENNKYGWFWECPNGGLKCHYRHALPSGFVLSKDKKKLDKKDELSIEDLIERERAQLGNTLTRITLETFLAWKKKKLKEKQEIERNEQDRKRAEFKAGRHIGLSGRDMFTFNPLMADDDDMDEDEATLDIYNEDENEGENEKGNIHEITLESLIADAKEINVDGITVVEKRHWQLENSATAAENNELGNLDKDAIGGNEDAVPIDENLFDDDEDLDELEESLDNLDME